MLKENRIFTLIHICTQLLTNTACITATFDAILLHAQINTHQQLTTVVIYYIQLGPMGIEHLLEIDK